MRKLFAAILLFVVSLAWADELKLAEDAPDRYVVVKGDTLWDISARFLKDPWRWPEIWHMNREEIANPHLIYPGDVILLDRSGPTLRVVRGEVIKLSPQIRSEPIGDSPIPSIPMGAIIAFLSQPRVVDAEGLKGAPRVISVPEERVMAAANDVVYATPGPADQKSWHIFRPGRALHDPDTQEVLGYEVEYIGESETKVPGSPQTLLVTKSVQEVLTGDRLQPVATDLRFSYVPRAPDQPVTGRVIGAYGGVSDAGQYATVVLNRGLRDGLAEGHVLAVYRRGKQLDVPACPDVARDKTFATLRDQDGYKESCANEKATEAYVLPDTRTGLIFVYRVFDRAAYALVVQTTGPIVPGDDVRNP
jgi:hypothetical protein